MATPSGWWGRAERKPRLPAWLSVPVICCAPLVVLAVVFIAVQEPVVVPLAFVPLLLIVPVLVWIDRLEPEPRAARLHAFLWGATVAVLAASIANVIVIYAISEEAAMVGSAPLAEETMKGLGILWMVRRKEIDGPLDGLVYAGWVAAGFAVVENLEYFLVASEEGVLAQTFAVRALITPFTHPLFTIWIGLAIGLAVARRRRLPLAALWGWLIAVGLHAAWNGSIVLTITTEQPLIAAAAGLAFIGVFALSIVLVIRTREKQRDAYLAAIPFLAHRYRIPPHEIGMFSSWPQMLAARRTLSRPQRRRFDQTHAALARLAALHAQPGLVDPVAEQRLLAQLHAARQLTDAR